MIWGRSPVLELETINACLWPLAVSAGSHLGGICSHGEHPSIIRRRFCARPVLMLVLNCFGAHLPLLAGSFSDLRANGPENHCTATVFRAKGLHCCSEVADGQQFYGGLPEHVGDVSTAALK